MNPGQNSAQNLVNFFNFGSSYPYGPVAGGTGIEYIAMKAIWLINSVAVPLLFAIAFIMFLYGVAKTYIFSNGDPDEVGQGHKLILWGIIGFVVMISLWGLVNIVANTFGLQFGTQNSFVPMQPNSYLLPGVPPVY